MLTTIVGALVLVASTTTGELASRPNAAPQAPAETPSAAERVKALEQKLRALRQALDEDYAKTGSLSNQEREIAGAKLFTAFQEQARKLGDELLGIARAAPAQASAVDAIRVALGADLRREALSAALGILEEHHARGEAIAAVLPELAGYGDAAVAHLLQVVLDTNPSARTRAIAGFELAMRTRDEAARERLLERVVAELGASEPDAAPLKARAERALFALRNLKIGMQAPEITGKDMEGVAFALSDYRGRVVVLDFWGYW
jgi:hypothetical protein